jgi:hypothetical protein
MKKAMHRMLIAALATTLAGSCVAATSTISERESSEGAIELSNLLPEGEGTAVVEGTPAADNTVQPSTAYESNVRRSDDAPAVSPSASESSIAQPSEAVRTDASPFNRNQGYTPGSGGYSNNGTLAGSPTPNNFGVPGSTGDGTGTGGSTQPPSGAVVASLPPSGPSTVPGSILDNPNALDSRLQQYREQLLNEPVLASGQHPNPAVVRRYQMVNRYTYTGR